MISYAECSARERLARLLDAGSFHEWLAPSERITSPHLAQLGVPCAFDDGVAIGRARLDGREVFVAAQEGAFMGGGVGEVHGAKLVGLLQRALRDRPTAVLLLAESGGVRLHEANAGLIAVSEVMRALLDVRAAGIPVIVLIGGANGCFGGMGIVARCADHIVMSEAGRLAMSGPEVIEASHGVEEFDSRDRALVWRTTGGKHRYASGDCDVLVDDDVQAFRAAAIAALGASMPLTPAALEAEHALLNARLHAPQPD
jgi:malonate decarboxylase beta subunit